MSDVKILLVPGIVLLIAVLIARFRVMPLLALALGTMAFGLVAGSDPQWVAKGFNTGFGQTIASGGLALLAGAMVAALGRHAGALAWWQARMDTRGLRWLGLGLALLAGPGGSLIGVLAVLTPLLELVRTARTRFSLAVTAVVNAAQGALLPAPLPIAALAILEADWRRGVLFGLPLVLLQIAAGLAYARRGPEDGSRPKDGTSVEPAATPPARLAALGFLLAVLCLIGLVLLHALGQIPSEPFGSGNSRERLIGAGRPILLLLAGVLIAALFMGRRAAEALAENGPPAAAMRAVAGVLLVIGAAGGLHMVLHIDGFAELAAERVGDMPATFGLAVPFLIALSSRALQGSALSATITAAGIMQPLVGPMGLDGEAARALVALSCASGAMALPHVNDGGFWLACHQAGLSAPQGLRWITGGALIQGAVALVFLIVLHHWAQ
jgi:gluconate:H+ symporter, GntP family